MELKKRILSFPYEVGDTVDSRRDRSELDLKLDTTAFSFSLKPAMCAGRVREQTKARLDNANT